MTPITFHRLSSIIQFPGGHSQYLDFKWTEGTSTELATIIVFRSQLWRFSPLHWMQRNLGHGTPCFTIGCFPRSKYIKMPSYLSRKITYYPNSLTNGWLLRVCPVFKTISKFTAYNQFSSNCSHQKWTTNHNIPFLKAVPDSITSNFRRPTFTPWFAESKLSLRFSSRQVSRHSLGFAWYGAVKWKLGDDL